MDDPAPPARHQGRNALGVALIAVVAVALWLWADRPTIDEATIRAAIDRAGALGPVALIALMTLAIVVSPIPSGPIALGAGAIYGTLWGAVYVIAGAVAGAVIAFGLARRFGHAPIRQSKNRVLRFIAAPRSQWTLMAVVFASRLIPFISFDAVSYAAGVTAITFPRFLLATAAGVVPVSFALTAMGAGLGDHAPGPWLLGGLAVITLLPVIGKWLWDRVR